MQKVENKVAIVTGGSSGIGLGIARQLAAKGAKVVLVGRNQAALDEVGAEIGGLALRADVTDPDALREVADTAMRRFGRIDILVNNAGIGPTARLADMTRTDWRWLLDSNVWSVINGLEVFLPIMRANPDGGHIVNTSSVAGMFTAPGIGGYAATKYAIVAISETLAQEFAREGVPIGVSVFLPGPVRSNIHLGSRNRPAGTGGALQDTRLEDAEGFEGVTIPWMEADDAGALVVEAITSDRLYVWTHPDGTAAIRDRFRAIEQSIADTAKLLKGIT